MNVEEMRPFLKKVNTTVKVLDRTEIREVTSRLDDSSHKVTEFLVGDSTGTILLTAWDKAIDEIELGKIYDVENGFTSLFKNSIRLNLGRFGKINSTETAIDSVHRENNLSEKEFEYRKRI